MGPRKREGGGGGREVGLVNDMKDKLSEVHLIVIEISQALSSRDHSVTKDKVSSLLSSFLERETSLKLLFQTRLTRILLSS